MVVPFQLVRIFAFPSVNLPSKLPCPRAVGGMPVQLHAKVVLHPRTAHSRLTMNIIREGVCPCSDQVHEASEKIQRFKVSHLLPRSLQSCEGIVHVRCHSNARGNAQEGAGGEEKKKKRRRRNKIKNALNEKGCVSPRLDVTYDGGVSSSTACHQGLTALHGITTLYLN